MNLFFEVLYFCLRSIFALFFLGFSNPVYRPCHILVVIKKFLAPFECTVVETHKVVVIVDAAVAKEGNCHELFSNDA